MLVSNLRPSELGARLGLSKQAANELVGEFEAKGSSRAPHCSITYVSRVIQSCVWPM